MASSSTAVPSFRLPLLTLLILAALALVLSCLASLLWGAGDISTRDAWLALIGQGPAAAEFIVGQLRWPRTLVAIMVGMALACAGALMQTLARNPLAEPGLLGISAGSSFAVTLALLVGASLTTLGVYVAQLGAFIGCVLVLSAARIQGVGNDPVRLVLAGATLTSLLLAVMSLILLFDQRTADEIRFWITGSVAGRSLDQLRQVIPSLLMALALTLWVIRPLAALALGERIAQGLGHKPGQVRLLTVMIVALLVGSATAVAGPLMFVGLVVPFIARALAGPDIRRTLWFCLLLGPVLVLNADTLSRLIAAPAEMPLGVLTALIGAPVLLAIVRSQRMPML